MLLTSAENHGVDLKVNHFGSMINPFFTNQDVTDFKSAQSSDTESFKVFFWQMMEHGVFLPPSQFEAWFLTIALNKKDMEKLKNAIDLSMAKVAEKQKLKQDNKQ